MWSLIPSGIIHQMRTASTAEKSDRRCYVGEGVVVARDDQPCDGTGDHEDARDGEPQAIAALASPVVLVSRCTRLRALEEQRVREDNSFSYSLG
jgi:hypothetical protein